MANKWVFPSAAGGEFTGFNDAGIETFAGSPVTSLAREIIQNSLDARPDGSTAPVQVYLDRLDLKKSEIPDLSTFKEEITSACEQAKLLGEEETEAFFTRAIKLLDSRKKTIPVLRIADSNTTGMIGPCKVGKPYHAYVKARGQSVKTTDQAGGSFGIGKHAPFALSELRCLFISTCYENGEDREQLAQGKAILMSRSDGGDAYTSGTGYYGSADCGPIEPKSKIPAWLRRDTQFSDSPAVVGTTIFVMGSRLDDNWKQQIVASVISNYFSAIQDSKLEVFIDDRNINIDADTLIGWFKNSDIQAAATASDQQEQFQLSHDMVRCLIENGTQTEEFQIQHLGNTRVRVLVAEGTPKRVGITRNGMLITRRLQGLAQFPGFADFVAVVDFLDPNGNKFLRGMENPAHDTFEPERLKDAKEVRKGRNTLKALGEKVREALRRHAQIETGPTTLLDEMAEFFQDPEEEGIAEDPNTGEADLDGQITLEPPKIKKQSETKPSTGPGGGGKVSGGLGGGGGSGPGPGKGSHKGAESSKMIPLKNVRCRVDPSKPRYREIMFTPERSGTVNLLIQDVGADAIYPLYVDEIHAGGGKAKGGNICKINLSTNKRVVLKVTLKEEFLGSLRVSANEV